MIFSFIEAETAQHSLPLMCRVLRVSRSGYYAWRERPPSSRDREASSLAERIRRIHHDSRGTYGAPRSVPASTPSCAPRALAPGQQASSGAADAPGGTRRLPSPPQEDAANHPKRPAGGARRGSRGAGFHLPGERPPVGRRYLVCTELGGIFDCLAFILDAYSRRCVGWTIAGHLRAELVTDALAMALWRRDPAPGVIHHSDRGSQYTSISLGARLEEAAIVPSMGSVADPYDNALAESFVATLKRELVERRSWPAREEVRTAIFEFVEAFYNRKRLHSSLGYQSPADYEESTMGESVAA